MTIEEVDPWDGDRNRSRSLFTVCVGLGDRNAAALGELQQVLSDGSGQRISLFYGAAHMPGIERALLEELEFSMSEQTWLDAWVIP